PLEYYWLAKVHSLHFTSPICRYADLVVHRALAQHDGKYRSRTDMSQVASIAEHVSTTERTAADAEIESVRMKKLEFFQRQLDERNPQIFRAAIVDVRNYGLAVELPDVLITARVNVCSLSDAFSLFESC